MTKFAKAFACPMMPMWTKIMVLLIAALLSHAILECRADQSVKFGKGAGLIKYKSEADWEYVVYPVRNRVIAVTVLKSLGYRFKNLEEVNKFLSENQKNAVIHVPAQLREFSGNAEDLEPLSNEETDTLRKLASKQYKLGEE